MSYNYCPHCGGSIGQNQTPGQMLTCVHCGKEIGTVPAALQKAAVDPVEEMIRLGTAGRCPICRQVFEVKGPAKCLIAHYAPGQKRICQGSGKPAGSALAAPPPPTPVPVSAPAAATLKTPGGRDLSKYYARDVIRVIWCQQGSAPRIEELTLDYLDKADRVRIQIEALRDILGPSFRMKDYPASLNRPHLAVWGNAAACVVARKHERGGYEPMGDAEMAMVVSDVKNHEALFLA